MLQGARAVEGGKRSSRVLFVERATDYEAAHLRCAGANLVEFGVGQESTGRIVFCVAVAACRPARVFQLARCRLVSPRTWIACRQT